jgi:hypothetical protein
MAAESLVVHMDQGAHVAASTTPAATGALMLRNQLADCLDQRLRHRHDRVGGSLHRGFILGHRFLLRLRLIVRKYLLGDGSSHGSFAEHLLAIAGAAHGFAGLPTGHALERFRISIPLHR